MEAYKMAFINWFNFDDRSRRAEYWKFVAVYNLILLIVFIICVFLNEYRILTGFVSFLPFFVVHVVHFIPSLSLSVRRIHDTGHSSKCIIFALLSMLGLFSFSFFVVILQFVGLIFSLFYTILLFVDSDKENNGWGESPKYYTED